MARKRTTWKPGEAFVEGFVDHVQIPAGKRDVIVWDGDLGGFGCRKFASGRASYIVQYDRLDGATRRLSLGPVVDGNVKTMRQLASEILARRRLGEDAIDAKRALQEAAVAPRLSELLPLYLADRKAEMKPRSHVEISRHLNKVWRKLHAKPLAAIARGDVADLVDDLARTRGKTAADRARTSLSTFFAWAIDKQHAEANPCIGIKDRAPANGGRTRTLTEGELVQVWRATGNDHDHDRIVRLLILTGCRREEIGGLAWAEVNTGARQLELPTMRTKNNRPHIVPLSKAAIAVLAGVERREGNPFVFGRLGTPFSGWSRCKERLDDRLGEMAAWTLHDLRRSFATLVRERRLADPHLVELIINHVSGTRGGVAGVYDRSERLEERRAALEAWGKHVTGLVRKKANHVVSAH
jgi:integrase